MTIEQQNKILLKALLLIGEYLRKNPPGNLDDIWSEPGMINILTGGAVRDPKGTEWVAYYIKKAKKELEEKGEL